MGDTPSSPLRCELSRNLVSHFCPGWDLNPGPRSLMAANVTTRLRRTPRKDADPAGGACDAPRPVRTPNRKGFLTFAKSSLAPSALAIFPTQTFYRWYPIFETLVAHLMPCLPNLEALSTPLFMIMLCTY